MTAVLNRKGISIVVIAIAVMAMVSGLFVLHQNHQRTVAKSKFSQPAYQTGKAFEVIEPEKPATQTSDTTPEQLVTEAERIIAKANKIAQKYDSNPKLNLQIDSEEVGDRVAKLKQKITELESQLEQ